MYINLDSEMESRQAGVLEHACVHILSKASVCICVRLLHMDVLMNDFMR